MDIDKKRQNALEKINETWFFESWLFENKQHRENYSCTYQKTRTNKIINETGDITTDITQIQWNLRYWYEQSYNNNPYNLEEMEKSLDAHNLS